MIRLKLFGRAYGYLIYFYWYIHRDTDGTLFRFLHKAICAIPICDVTGITEEEVIWAINYAIALLPTETKCLQRACATTKLLREQGLPARLVIGATTPSLKRHAWVEIGTRAVNERVDTQTIYSVLERC